MSTVTTPARVDDGVAALIYCPSCRHRHEVHDATSSRYCAATLGGSIDRGCICRGDLTDMAPLAVAAIHTG